MAENIKYRFIENVGDYFPAGYFNEDFIDKVQKTSGYSSDDMAEMCKPYVQLRREYDAYKNYIVNTNPRTKDAIKHTHDFNTRLLEILGYDANDHYTFFMIDEENQAVVPVRQVLYRGNGVSMLIMEMQHLIQSGDQQPSGLFEQKYNEDGDEQTTRHQRYYAGQWSEVFDLPADCHISPAVINKAIDAIFLLPPERRPHYILMMAGNMLFLLDSEKWGQESYLQFSLDELFSQASISAFRKYYALFHLLVCKDTLASDSETVLMDRLVEESYKSAYEVTKDLKIGVVNAVETLANEALYWWRLNDSMPVSDYTDDLFESQVKDDCLTIVYRLLFIFYAESRDELEILPADDEVYNRGYSLEMLRDLEQIHLLSQASKDGYFFHESLSKLFGLLSSGYHESREMGDKTFTVRHIDSPLFNDKRLHHLGTVKFRNEAWQNIIRNLSLNRKKPVGRISYANLGVNQLGSVYESLLAYRGFYAEEDYIEVHTAGSTSSDDTFLVPYSRMDDFEPAEILCDDDGSPVILKRGTFVYRLNGRDRQKSASYYTPEILTQSTVKYTLKSIIDDVAAGKRKASELLDLKILEPAMGAAAFQNEVINQLAKAYLTYREAERRQEGIQNWRLSPDHYRDELQKVKAYIATHNVYGVDLNPTAIELGKLALWLNVMHKDMETPFFSSRLALGNAVVGAWLKVYGKDDFIGIKGTKGKREVLLQNKWWEKAPRRISFQKNGIKRSVNEVYHFLLPDANMLAVRTIKDYKDQAKQERQDALNHDKPTDRALKRMKAMIDDWTAPITDDDFRRLQRICGKFDVLLKEFYQFQLSVENQTQNKVNLWGVTGAPVLNFDSYEEKERLNNIRYEHDHPYFRLKMVMDYWCALWFWGIEDVDSLPTRAQYWADIEAMLNVSDDQLDSRTSRAINRDADIINSKPTLFPELEQPNLFTGVADPDDQGYLPLLSKDAILATGGAHATYFDQSPRFHIVKRLSDRYHFFHPMLEFIEVFWLRNGFDIICGNPPWVMPTFDIIDVFSEKFPEIVLNGFNAPEVRDNKISYFSKCPGLDIEYYNNLVESSCSNAFTNAICLYPYLVGKQTDLYMCILESSLDLLSSDGYIGMVHPESIYDTAKLDDFRENIYHRLKYHFQYQNEFKLFAEVHNETTYGVNVYGPYTDTIGFASIHNIFHPSTVDACFIHNGEGICHGVKYKGKWNTEPHKDRIVYFDAEALQILSNTFEADGNVKIPKLVSVQSNVVIDVIEKFSLFPHHVKDYRPKIKTGLHETGQVDDGTMQRMVSFPKMGEYVIFNGPHIYVNAPMYKMPRTKMSSNRSYDTIDYTRIDDNFVPATCFVPAIPNSQFKEIIKGFIIGQDENGKNIYDCWLDHYKLGISEWVGSTSERTLSGGILPPGTHHIGTIVSVTFKDVSDMVELCGIINSIPLDFYMKITGASHVKQYRIDAFPLGIANKFKEVLFPRVLMLNCLTKAYSRLWEEMWREDFRTNTWSIDDNRLKPFDTLTSEWTHETPLRNLFERRMAMVECDVIVAMALGLSLKDLEELYVLQFPVVQQYENDTWYDKNGSIIYTKATGLNVGLRRKGSTGVIGWEDMRGDAIISNDVVTGYKGIAPTYTHIIDPEKSEIYGGQQQVFVAPYTRCDRIADYRRAWQHFSYLVDN